MPRHKRHDRPIEKAINLPESIVEQVDVSVRDPLTGKPAFGAWSELVSSLLEGWLEGRFEVRLKPFSTNLNDLMGDDSEEATHS